MKKILSFLKTAIVDGFLVILPIVLVVLILAEIYGLVLLLTDPIEALLPAEKVGGIDIAIFLAIAIILIGCFLIGLLARTRSANKIGNWFEKTVFMRLPGYKLLKSFSDRFTGVDSSEHFTPGLFRSESDTTLLVLIVEEFQDDRAVIFVPMVPTPGVGTLQIVPRERLQKTDIPMNKFMDCIFNFGIGANDLLKK